MGVAAKATVTCSLAMGTGVFSISLQWTVVTVVFDSN